MTNLPEHQTYLKTLSALNAAKDSLAAAESLYGPSSSDYEAALNEAAQEEKPSKAAISKALDTFLLIKIRERRLDMAKAKVIEAETDLDIALHHAAAEMVKAIQKWEAAHITAEVERMINGQTVSTSHRQSAEKIANESEIVSRSRQLALALCSPQGGEAGKAALDRGAAFLQEHAS